MKEADIAAAWAEKTARDDTHGYDQGSRWSPDYDCSSLVISAYKQAGVPLTCTYTGNMKSDMLSRGFKDITKKVNLSNGSGMERGDVMLHEAKHTAMYLGNGKLVHAAGNEYGKATGGKTGDQTGKEICITGYFNFPWECVLRYEGNTGGTAGAPSPTGAAEGIYTVRSGDSLWGIAERELGNGFLYEEIKKLNRLDGYTIYPGQVLKLPGDAKAEAETDPKETVTVELERALAEKIKKAAEENDLSLSELIEDAFELWESIDY